MRTPKFIEAAAPAGVAPAVEAAAGLLASPPRLPPKFFYDALGSRLFAAVTELPEYYLPRAEAAMFAAQAEPIRAAVRSARRAR